MVIRSSMSTLRSKRLPAPEIEGFDSRERAILAHATARHAVAQADADDAATRLRLAVLAVMWAEAGAGTNPVVLAELLP